MVRQVLPRVHIYSLALIVSAFHRASSSTVSTVDCTRFDIGELEDYLSKVHSENPLTIDTMIGKFTSPVTELPFGALSSDWRRLLLLQRAQPEGSILREKLGRLFRILTVAYSQTMGPSDITEPATLSTTSSWDAFTSESINKFEGIQEEAEKLGTLATDSTETNQIFESFTSTNLPGLEELTRAPEIELTAFDTTVSYDERFDYSTNAIDSSSITIRSSTFETNYKISTLTNQNSIEKEKTLENMKDFNNSASDNNSSDDSVNNRANGYTPRVISSAAFSAPKADGKRLDSSMNPIDSSVITATSSTFELNTIASSTTQSLAGQNSIGENKRSENFESINNPTFRNYDELAINKIDKVSQQMDRLTTQQQINIFNITALPFYTTTTSTNTRSSDKSSTSATTERDRSLTNLKSINNSVMGMEDDLVESVEINTLNTTASPFYTTTTSTNTRSAEKSSTTGATIEEDESFAKYENTNNLVVQGKDDDLVDLRFTTQEHQEIDTFNTTALPFNIIISTITMSSEESSATRAIIEGDESGENTKVVTFKESDSVNQHQGEKMAVVGKETVGFAKGGTSDHFRGAEVATVAAEAAAAVGGFVAGKSSVAGTIVEKDAQPITSLVSGSGTPGTPFGSDFSTSRIQDYGTMDITLAAVGIKESDSVVPTRTEIAIARGRGDSPLVYTPMNSEDQENTAEHRGTPNTSDPTMTDVKTTIEQSRVHTDRIRGNEVPGDGSLGQQPVHRKDGGVSSTHQSIQNFGPYRDEITKPSVSRKPKVDSEFSNRIVTPQIVASTTGSPRNRPDPQRDNRSRTGSFRPKKRGSLNTDIEKSFRWFYNAEKDGGHDSNQRGIRIECSDNGHDYDNSVL